MGFNNEQSKNYNNQQILPKKFATCGNDNKIKIWKFENNTINEEHEISNHTGWVRDIAWLKYLGSRFYTLASCGEDCNLFIFQFIDGTWTKVFEKKFNFSVLSVSWSNCGTYLAASCSDNQIYFFMENILNKWEMINKIAENGDLISEVLDRNQ
jgi:WD40 repeat protein